MCREFKRDVIVVLRTGIGKSAIALLPPQVENTVTVIVVPLVVLLQDWKRRLDAMGIPYEEFDPSNPEASLTGGTSIVLVSADKATYPSFKAALARLNAILAVIRVIVDEAHIWFTDRKVAFDIVRNPRLGIGEAYMDGRVIIEDGTILDLLEVL